MATQTSAPPESVVATPSATNASVRVPIHTRCWPITAVTVLLIGLGVDGLWIWYHKSNTSREYVTLAADTGSVTPSVVASGTVNPVTTVQVGSYVSGVIKTLSCDFNTKVKAGQSCARIDARSYQSAVDQAAANVATANAQLEKDRANLVFSKIIYDRNTDLIRRHIISQEALDTATNAYQQARSQIALDQATIQQHRAALNAARINLGFTNIVSPVNGTVVTRNVTQGQTVAASFQTPMLFLIATDLTRMQVDANVSESDIGRIREGNAATFTVESFPEHSFSGVVTQVRQAPQTVQNVITYDVVINVSNVDLLLKPGMTASTRIVTERRDNVLRVPDQALRYTPASSSAQESGGKSTSAGGIARRSQGREAQVWVLRDGEPQRLPLKTGLEDENFIEVLQGNIRAGDMVIVSERSAGAKTATAASGVRPPRL
ncbi:MAG: efflux RND transporter periplasmic adaptor subunit [Pseudomonadota bacterium]